MRWNYKIAVLAVLAVAALAVIYSLDGRPSAETVPMSESASDSIDMLKVKVVERHPHAADAFTQGLVWQGGKLYESTGQRGASSLRQVDLLTGQVERRLDLPRELFGEGLALIGDRFIQLTWTSGTAISYRRDNFEKLDEFRYQGEGWGLCHDGTRLIMSNGSADLIFRDPDTFKQTGRVRATINGRPQSQLNELECVDGQVYANVWGYDQMVRIDPQSGRVTAIIDASGLLTPAERERTDVLNGIAYMPERKRFLITGKYWPHLFEVEFVPR